MRMICNQYLLPKLPSNYYNNTLNRRYTALKANKKDGHHYENYQVFQHQNITYNDDVNIKDVEDHLEAVHRLKKTDKDDYFMSHGLDYDRSYEYINIVKYLNRCFNLRNKHISYNDKLKSNPAQGCTILSIFTFIYYYVKDDL